MSFASCVTREHWPGRSLPLHARVGRKWAATPGRKDENVGSGTVQAGPNGTVHTLGSPRRAREGHCGALEVAPVRRTEDTYLGAQGPWRVREDVCTCPRSRSGVVWPERRCPGDPAGPSVIDIRAQLVGADRTTHRTRGHPAAAGWL